MLLLVSPPLPPLLLLLLLKYIEHHRIASLDQSEHPREGLLERLVAACPPGHGHGPQVLHALRVTEGLRIAPHSAEEVAVAR